MRMSKGGAVKDFMHGNLEIVPQETTAVLAATRMSVRRIGCVLVKSGKFNQGPLGIVTETDLVRKVIAKGMDPAVTVVGHVMSYPPLTIAADCSMLDASHMMEGNHLRHLCVVEDGKIVGVVSVRDLVRSFVDSESGPIRELDEVYRPLGLLMATSTATIGSEESMFAAAVQMTERRIGSLLTMEAGALVGVVTESDLVRKGLATNVDPGKTRISAVMSSPLLTIDVNCSIRDASQVMAERGVRHLGVSEHGKIVGMLSIRDLLKMVSVQDGPRFSGYT